MSRWNWLAAAATIVTAAVMAMYLWLIAQQGGQPQGWFVGALAAAIALGGFGSARAAPRRRAALTLCGTILVAVGLLSILSIGWPLLIAGALALAAAARVHDPVQR